MSKEICIVSGLPRSGTSLMMKMLEAGGMDIAIDNSRRADEDNPKGYYELEVVKTIKQDTSWLDGLVGKAFKMVSMLLYDLPRDRRYKIIFMRRNMEEILASQHVMLQRQGKPCNADEQATMRKLFAQHLEQVQKWLAGQSEMEVCYIWHHNLLQQPRNALRPVCKMLGRPLDIQRMADVVDASLYRQTHRTQYESSCHG
jgi:Sulfotransferase domain